MLPSIEKGIGTPAVVTNHWVSARSKSAEAIITLKTQSSLQPHEIILHDCRRILHCLKPQIISFFSFRWMWHFTSPTNPVIHQATHHMAAPCSVAEASEDRVKCDHIHSFYFVRQSELWYWWYPKFAIVFVSGWYSKQQFQYYYCRDTLNFL